MDDISLPSSSKENANPTSDDGILKYEAKKKRRVSDVVGKEADEPSGARRRRKQGKADPASVSPRNTSSKPSNSSKASATDIQKVTKANAEKRPHTLKEKGKGKARIPEHKPKSKHNPRPLVRYFDSTPTPNDKSNTASDSNSAAHTGPKGGKKAADGGKAKTTTPAGMGEARGGGRGRGGGQGKVASVHVGGGRGGGARPYAQNKRKKGEEVADLVIFD